MGKCIFSSFSRWELLSSYTSTFKINMRAYCIRIPIFILNDIIIYFICKLHYVHKNLYKKKISRKYWCLYIILLEILSTCLNYNENMSLCKEIKIKPYNRKYNFLSSLRYIYFAQFYLQHTTSKLVCISKGSNKLKTY